MLVYLHHQIHLLILLLASLVNADGIYLKFNVVADANELLQTVKEVLRYQKRLSIAVDATRRNAIC